MFPVQHGEAGLQFQEGGGRGGGGKQLIYLTLTVGVTTSDSVKHVKFSRS